WSRGLGDVYKRQVIRIAPGARIKEPIEICALPIGEESSFLRSFVIVGEGAEATIVESHGVSSPGAHRNHALNLEIGPGANVDHVAIMAAPNGGAVRVISLLAILAAGASFNSFGLIGNGGFVRRQIFVRLEGEGASATLGGATMSREADHADTTIHVEHAAQNTRSREHFRHIVDGAATGVFQGKIVVRSNAQKTSGAMQSRAILLSDNATMNNKPELEIFADDVQCGHGVTCGRLDKDQLFYLMARGLPRAEAEALLIEGFANEVFADVRNEALREELHGSVAAWLLMRSLAGEAS
ncbi:MAG: Fe-S cluster assembly protein SufD, partial [Methylocystis sp.]|nr:Fe-S cluster assembly protein SufD [Methylocystis sp.]